MSLNKRRALRNASQKKRIELLEKALSLKLRERLFGAMSRSRLKQRLSSWGAKLLILFVLSLIGFFIYERVRESAAKLRLEEIQFESQGYISKAQILKLLNLKSGTPITALNSQQLIDILEKKPYIQSANVIIELPDKLHIQIQERLPLAYVTQDQGLITGDRQSYFICDQGVMMKVRPEFHQSFLESPIWYVTPRDYDEFREGGHIKPDSLRPVLETLTAVNAFELDTIPRVKEIFRPKMWKTVLILSSGEEVTMSIYDIKEQIARLVLILEHARANKRHIRRVNVIPKTNPSVIYFPAN